MGHKRKRNYYPRLPEAVLNLLALHSLTAWPAKYTPFPRGAKVWAWKVFKTGENHLTSRAVFTVAGSHDLEYWMDVVKLYAAGKTEMFFDVKTQIGRWSGNLSQCSKLWIDELKDIEARIAAMIKLP